MDKLSEEEKGKYEILDGKKIPMRHWNVDLTTQEIALIVLSITESIMPTQVLATVNRLSNVDQKTEIVDKFLKMMSIKGFDSDMKEKIKRIAEFSKKLEGE
jgi:hypothetical protein